MSVYDTEDTHVNANLSYLARRRHQIVISVSWEMKDWMRDSFAEIDQSCCGSKKRRPTLSPPRWYQLFRFHLNPFRERKVFFANCSRFAGSCLELPSEACRDRLFCWTLVNAVSEPLSRTAGRSTFKLGKRGEHGVFLTRPICVCNVSSNLCNWPVRDEEGDVWALNFPDNMLRVLLTSWSLYILTAQAQNDLHFFLTIIRGPNVHYLQKSMKSVPFKRAVQISVWRARSSSRR